MSKIFRAQLAPSADKPGAVSLAWTAPDNSEGEEMIGADAAMDMRNRSRAFMRERAGSRQWVEFAWKLYDILNTGGCGLENFHGSGRPPLELRICAEGNTRIWPFELIRMIFDIRIVREIDTDSSCSVPDLNSVEDRMLLLVFMACAPQVPGDEFAGGQLYFEKEEEAIFEATRNGAVELDVEDTGSLDGLAEKLREEKFDVVHISCHANIDREGPLLCMETDIGELHRVGPEALWENCLKQRPPHIVFLSACRSGESGGHEAASSFCEGLVARGLPMAIGWGVSVADPNATRAAQIFYGELSLGITALEAVAHTREKLMSEGDLFWPFLRVFVSPEVADFAIVSPPGGRKRLPKRRITKLKQLGDAGVNVLMEGFVGRRREVQKGLRALRDTEAAGVFIHGAGGLGKSCLAGRLAERFPERGLIIVHGILDENTFVSALLKGFNRSKNLSGIRMIKERGVNFSDKIPVFCSTVFSEAPYIILLDDFGRNIVVENGEIKRIVESAKNILDLLIENFPECMGVTKLIITSRYSLPLDGFEYISMRAMKGAEEKKKIERLTNINSAPPPLREKLIEYGRGNPKLMELLNSLAGRMEGAAPERILLSARGEMEKFAFEHLVNVLAGWRDEKFERFIREASAFGVHVPETALEAVSDAEGREALIEKGVALGLIEKDVFSKFHETSYMVSPLIREKFFHTLPVKERKQLRRKTLDCLGESQRARKPCRMDNSHEIVRRSLHRKTWMPSLEFQPQFPLHSSPTENIGNID